MVSPDGSFGSSVRLPMLFVPRPCDTQRHPTSSLFIASSLRQTPPPAVPTHSRQRPSSSQVGEMASAETRPDTDSELPDVGLCRLVSGPRLVQIAPWPMPLVP